MTLPPLKICRRIRQMYLTISDPNVNLNVAGTACKKLIALLAKHALVWNDIPACIAEADAADAARAPKPAAPSAAAGPGPEVNVLDLVLHLIEQHFVMTPEEKLVTALWALHCYVFNRFDHTPRLLVLSPTSRCGKSNLLKFLMLLVPDPYYSEDVTAAAVRDELARGSRTLLLDEGDNLGLLQDRKLRRLFLSGQHRDGYSDRFIGGRSHRVSTFAPMALAAIEVKLPLPMLTRSITITMQRAPKGLIKRLKFNDPDFPATREQIGRWAATCRLNPDPELLFHTDYIDDNLRVLIAIADDLGYGEQAHAAMRVLVADRPEEDPGVILLNDIRSIFLALGTDRIASKALLKALHALDDGNSIWNEWRGRNDDRPSHKLTDIELSQLLRPFKPRIRPRSIWPLNRKPGDKSFRGYMKSWFESAWAAYCPSPDTPTQASKIIHLPRPTGDT
jgi:Protein of unknown function (DUF3631)